MDKPSIPFKRLALEGLVIFLGVTAGFLADDYRDYLNDRRREAGILHQLLADLALDSADIEPVIAEAELREAAMTWFSSRAYSPYPSSDSVNLILNGLGTGMFVTYEPSALTYSSLKASGDLGIIQNPALRDTIVYYYEDRQPVLLDNNAKAVEAELAWRESLAPHVRTTPASSLRRYPELRVDAPSRLFDDRMLRHRSILMGHLFSFQASNARAMQRINERLRAAIRRELDDGQATG